MEFFLVQLLPAVPIGYGVLQVMALRRWRGRFRLAAAVPLPGWGAWLANLIRDLSIDPTSHNLFPFEILIGAVAALVYLALLAIFRRLLL
jgi:hypothetical protein